MILLKKVFHASRLSMNGKIINEFNIFGSIPRTLLRNGS
jgi:hypothetical protein